MGNQQGSPVEEIVRIAGASLASVGVFSQVITDPDQSIRLGELISKHDFPGLLRALTSSGGVRFDPEFFPGWIRSAGGYFPKFAQVLSVRADLIDDPRVLQGFSRCLEDMPSCPDHLVRSHLQEQGWPEASCAGVGRSLNAGTVAQVNEVVLQGMPAVVKVTWPSTRKKFVIDFRLFSHARQILSALQLRDEKARIVAAMFDAVAKSEPSVMEEFDLLREAHAMQMAAELCGQPWNESYRAWQRVMLPIFLNGNQDGAPGLPPQISDLAAAALQRSQTWHTRVPEPDASHSNQWAMVMTRADGQSLHELMNAGRSEQLEGAKVLIGYVVPLIGWLLLCKSSSHLAHVDPHLGNFRWHVQDQTLWVLDWGSHVKLTEEKRRSFCMLVSIIARDGEDALIADMAKSLGVSGESDEHLAKVMRGILNATSRRAAQDTLEHAAHDSLLKDISSDVVPVVRCLAILGGTLKVIQQKFRDEYQQDVPLSLASLWAPFAAAGLH
eukprot:TRINITY_DN93520_c0_g1_i1.p1 TRINITY_DN93520_c0_g1~~TRINITY_DN93520_c0_g1_i1.p1  ORF type:complete len:497 (-),score=75.47 TRINITY_DN93520_c0_g1_i1:77-1567(-)